MKTVVAKLDNKTAYELDELAKGTSRSQVVREAVRQYIARNRVEARRREVEEYMRTRTSGEREKMRELAESDMDHAAEILARVEAQK